MSAEPPHKIGAEQDGNKSGVDAEDAFGTLSEGDVIRVPQYKNALEVTNVALDVGMLGVKFVDDSKKTSTLKHLIQNEDTGLVALVAGTSDKGRVDEIEIVSQSREQEAAR